jgi:conjugal transfer/type IV secretion protein DotA/TraY
MYKNNNKIWKIFFTAILLAMSNFAFADSGNLFDVPNTDVSLIILSRLFGSLTQISGTDAFAGAIATFNGAILFIGGILASYTILAGTLGTAHDGQMLGKKFSSVWIPIRYSIGTSLVLPILSNGYCIMQQLIIWSIMQGIGLANAVWTSYLSTVNTTNISAFQMTKGSKEQVKQLAGKIAINQMCIQSFVLGKTSGGWWSRISNFIKETDYKAVKDEKNHIWKFGDSKGNFTKAACGSATYPYFVASEITFSNGKGTNNGKLGDLTSAFTVTSTEFIYKAHEKALETMITNFETKAKSTIKEKSVLSIDDVYAEADTYVNSINSSISSSSFNAYSGMVEASKTQGWFLAGAWYTKLAMMNKTVSDAVSAVPTATASNNPFTFLNASVNDTMQETFTNAISEIRQSKNPLATEEMSAELKKTDKDSKQTPASSTSGDFFNINKWLVEGLTTIDMSNLQNSNDLLIVQIQKMGISILHCWEIIISLITGLTVAGAFMSNAFIALAITLVGFFMAPITALLGIGVALTYGIPNMPFLMWIGVLLGWVILVIEAVLAGPLWAIMHLHPNGDDITGRGGNGYSLLLGVLFRPVLSIFGLIGSLAVTELMGEFINKIFFSVLYIPEQAGGVLFLISTIFAMATYTSAIMQLFKKTFSLMHVIPDQMMRWAGGSAGGELGQYAGGLSGATDAGVSAAKQGAQLTGDVSKTMPALAKEGAKGIKDYKENQAKKEAQKVEQEKGRQNVDSIQEKTNQDKLSSSEGVPSARETVEKLQNFADKNIPGGSSNSMREQQKNAALNEIASDYTQHMTDLNSNDKENSRNEYITDSDGNRVLDENGNFMTNHETPRTHAFSELTSKAADSLSMNGGENGQLASFKIPGKDENGNISDKNEHAKQITLEGEISAANGNTALGLRSYQQKLANALLNSDVAAFDSLNKVTQTKVDPSLLFNPNPNKPTSSVSGGGDNSTVPTQESGGDDSKMSFPPIESVSEDVDNPNPTSGQEIKSTPTQPIESVSKGGDNLTPTSGSSPEMKVTPTQPIESVSKGGDNLTPTSGSSPEMKVTPTPTSSSSPEMKVTPTPTSSSSPEIRDNPKVTPTDKDKKD